MHKPTLDWLHKHNILEAVMTAMRGPDLKWDARPIQNCNANWLTIKNVTTGVLRWVVGYEYGVVVNGNQWRKGLPHEIYYRVTINSSSPSHHFFYHIYDAVNSLAVNGYYLPNRIPLTAYLDPEKARSTGVTILEHARGAFKITDTEDLSIVDTLIKRLLHEDAVVLSL